MSNGASEITKRWSKRRRLGKKSSGTAAEELARDYLQKQGLRWLTSNFRCRLGEIDLIMQDGEQLVFIEVRYRTDTTAAASVNYRKQQKLIKAAAYYLQQQRLSDKFICRFDVVALTANQLDWIKNAFYTH